ncbi:MAG TPA: type II secretion system inner membrane protein GspF [Oligoflexia bacterium]|nr:type II secretion system inner membrane protein GspF [Oligoflexia bacterium]HMP27067.1 type II secretion system inner membrane protein GspF [Oligoflexia bacterium]
MPVFEYTAINTEGKKIKGSVEADNVRTARQKLKNQRIYATEMREALSSSASAPSQNIGKYFQTNRIALKDLAPLTRQLATLVGAGLPLVGAISILADQSETALAKRTLVDIKERVEQGSSLAEALSQFPRSFPRLYINMVASGEASGTLDAVLENLANYLEAQLELRRKIISSLFYPALMLVFCTLVVIALVAFVVPPIIDVFNKQGATLPLPTRILVGFSKAITKYWFIFIALGMGALYLCKLYYKQPNGRKQIDRLLLRLPLFTPLYIRIMAARVSGTLSALLGGSVGLLTSLDIVKNMVNNVHIVKALEDARDGVREGDSLAKQLSRSGVFPGMLCHMIAVGESSGRLEEMLTKASRAYENEVNATLAGLTSLIEPIMMIVLGGIVFAIVISILMPMVDMINLVQR